MKRILISILVLSIEEEYDIFIPIDMKFNQVINLIQKSIYELSEERYTIKKDNEVILFNEDGYIINTNNVVKFSGVKNGSKLVLV